MCIIDCTNDPVIVIQDGGGTFDSPALQSVKTLPCMKWTNLFSIVQIIGNYFEKIRFSHQIEWNLLLGKLKCF